MKELISAIRQYKSNDGSDGFIIAYGKEETEKAFLKIQQHVKELESDLIQTQMVVTEIQELSSKVSCFVENLNECDLMQQSKALNDSLEISSKIQDLHLPEFYNLNP